MYVCLCAVQLHAIVGRPSGLGRDPVDVLAGAFDVARLAVDAVLSVDLQPHSLLPVLPGHKLVHPGRAKPLLRASEEGQVPFHWD